jgi:hypothetical protein
VLAEVRTHHWFDPCDLLTADARSEMKPECRRRSSAAGDTNRSEDEPRARTPSRSTSTRGYGQIASMSLLFTTGV